MTFESDIQLGERYRDDLTGFEGTATACYFFLHGCERVLLENFNVEKGEIREQTFDSPRLTHVESETKVTTDKTGGYKPEPPTRGPS
jgi:hypothetical protein